MTYTLAADGGSDRALLPILTWSVEQIAPEPVEAQWADFTRMPRRGTIEERLRKALDLYPCDVLFVHPDAEGQPPALRRERIAIALGETGIRHEPVVPVRMTEAWLLTDENAIRCAAGNPNGWEDLGLPDLRSLEDLPDPKTVLYDALRRASGLNARRRSKLPVGERVHLIGNYIDDYSALRALAAFRTLEDDIRRVLGSPLV